MLAFRLSEVTSSEFESGVGLVAVKCEKCLMDKEGRSGLQKVSEQLSPNVSSLNECE